MPRIRSEPTAAHTNNNHSGTAAAVLDAPTPPKPPEGPPAKAVAVVERRIETVVVEIPLGEIGNGHRPNHVEAWLKPAQAEALQRLVVALRDKRAVSDDGREIRTSADAMRWLLERVAAA